MYGRIVPIKESLPKYSIPRRKHLPIEFGNLLKKFTAWCKVCQKPFYPDHLEYHGMRRIQIEAIFEDLEHIRQGLLEGSDSLTNTWKKRKHKVKRETVMGAFSTHIKNILSDVDKILKEFAQDF